MEIDTKLFKHFQRISIGKNNNSAIRGHPSSQQYSYVRKGGSRKLCSVISLPIHSLTHFDIAKKLSLYDANNYYEPQIFKNIAIINLCNKKEILINYLLHEKDVIFEDVIYPFLDISKFENNDGVDILFNLLDELKIDYEKDLLKNLEGYDFQNLEGIIFRTDWSDFRFGNSELNNPFFELFHAFLIHPYLDLNILSLMKTQNSKLKLLGSDLPSLTNPAMFVDHGNTFPFIRKTCLKMLNQGNISNDHDIVEAFLENKSKYFIKNIGGLSIVQTEKEIVTVGNIILIPIPLLAEPTGMACELYFQRKPTRSL